MQIGAPLLLKFLVKDIKLTELADLPPERRTAIVDRVLNSTEYKAFQERTQMRPLLAAIFVGTVSLGTVSFANAGDLVDLFAWPLFNLAAIGMAILLGYIAKVIRQLLFAFVVLMNLCGLLDCVIRMDWLACVGAVVAAVLAYELTLTLGFWLLIAKGNRLLRSLVKQYSTCHQEECR